MQLISIYLTVAGAALAMITMALHGGSPGQHEYVGLIVLSPYAALLILLGLVQKLGTRPASRQAALATSIISVALTALAYLPVILLGDREPLSGLVFLLSFVLLPGVPVVFAIAYLIFRVKTRSMKQDESAPTPGAPERRIRLFGLSCNFRVFVAFVLGVISFLLTFALGVVFLESGKIGEFVGGSTFGIGLGFCFLISQYFLSHGNPQALHKLWPLIIAMNFVPFCGAVICLAVESKGAALGMLVVTIFTLACSYAGAALAARTARS